MDDSSGARMFAMAQEGDMTDMKIVVQGKEIAVHSAMAASRGGTLKELLKESKEKTVNIGDEIEPQVFEIVLK